MVKVDLIKDVQKVLTPQKPKVEIIPRFRKNNSTPSCENKRNSIKEETDQLTKAKHTRKDDEESDHSTRGGRR